MSTVAVTSGLGALPSRFRRERLLIVGYGDVGQRVARTLLSGPRSRAAARAGAHLAGRAAAPPAR
ncbi:hypothetical protein AcdelDRAFT_3757, partial [Acidovorax delafieldii 2AN]